MCVEIRGGGSVIPPTEVDCSIQLSFSAQLAELCDDGPPFILAAAPSVAHHVRFVDLVAFGGFWALARSVDSRQK